MAFDLNEEVTRRIKAGAVELPTYPGVALKLQGVVASANFGLGELARLVEADQALAINVLRAANSAYFRASAPVTTLQQAITRIGASELSNIAIAATLGLAASSGGALSALRKASWRKSLVDAALAQELAKERGLNGGEAFLAGLLCDFGETIAYSCFEAILGAGAPARPAEEWEREGQGLHVELGIVLAEKWKLPPFVAEVVMRHHGGDVTGCDFPELVLLIATTSQFAAQLLASPGVGATGLEAITGLTGSERAALDALVPTIPGLLQAFEEASPEVPPGPSAVLPTTTTLPPPVWPIDLPVAINKRGKAELYRATGITHLGARLEGTAPQPERHLVTLELPNLTVSATVKRCDSTPGGFTLEVHPFAMDRPAQTAWTELVRRARGGR